MSACSCGEGTELVRVVTASCVVGVSECLLFRLRMSLQSLEGFVLKDISASMVFHLVSCSCRISSVISWFSVCIWFMISGVGNCRLR